MKKYLFALVSVLIVSTLLLSACAKATPVPTEAPAVVEPTEAPVATTEAPTAEPTEVPPTPTPPPTPVCELMENPPAAPAAGDLGSPENPIVIAFVPSGDTGKITTAGQGIADCLNQMTGLSFKIEVGTSFGASIEAMGAGKAQVGFLNTFSALLAKEKYGLGPSLVNVRKYATNDVDPDKDLAGTMQPFYKGQFIAKADSGIATLEDLKGKTFCFVDPNSTSGYVIPRIMLLAAGVDPDVDLASYQMAGSHDNVAIAVYNGDCDAGITWVDIVTDEKTNLAGAYPDIAEVVKPFLVTERIPNDGVQFIEGFDESFKAAIIQGLLKMTEDDGGKYLLKSLYSINGYIEVDKEYYQPFLEVLIAAGVKPCELVGSCEQ